MTDFILLLVYTAISCILFILLHNSAVKYDAAKKRTHLLRNGLLSTSLLCSYHIFFITMIIVMNTHLVEANDKNVVLNFYVFVFFLQFLLIILQSFNIIKKKTYRVLFTSSGTIMEYRQHFLDLDLPVYVEVKSLFYNQLIIKSRDKTEIARIINVLEHDSDLFLNLDDEGFQKKQRKAFKAVIVYALLMFTAISLTINAILQISEQIG